MAIRIKPRVEEISLAFNPANRKKFILHKEEGGKVMKYAISILEKDDQVADEKEFLAFLKDQKLSDETTEALHGIYRLVVVAKDKLPASFVANLSKSFPILSESFTPKIDEKTTKKAEKELRVTIEKEIRATVEKEMGMTKDVEIQKLSDTVVALQKESDETKKLLAVEKDARRLAELEKEIKSFEIPGDIAKMTKDALDAEKVSPEFGKRILDSFKEFGTAFKAKDLLFKEFGSSGEGLDEDSALGRLKKIAKEKMEKDKDLTEIVAFSQAAKENPELYREYNKDHFRKVNAH